MCLLGLGLSGLLVLPLPARVGESQTQLESRLLSNRTGIEVPTRQVKQIIDHRSVPYRSLYEYFPENAVHELYFKPAEDDAATTSVFDATDFPDGWLVHVVYYKGRSVFEAYRRNGDGMSKYEEEGLLMLNKGDSHWNRATKEEARQTVLGVNYKRTDGEVFAVKKGQTFIFYMPEFDQGIKTQLEEDQQDADEKARENAPDSVRGF